MKYRKKPILVEAVQWFYDCPGASVSGAVSDMPNIHTVPGPPACIENGDWVVTEPCGARYICKPDAFRDAFEPAPSPDPAPDPEVWDRKWEPSHLKV